MSYIDEATQHMRTVLELACVTTDRTAEEQASLLSMAGYLDSIGAHPEKWSSYIVLVQQSGGITES